MVYLKSVSTINISSDKCTGCGMCIDVCPREVLRISDKKANVISRDNCIECGACSLNCAFDAITVKSGVGCAAAMILGIIKYGDPEKGECGCSETSSGCC